MSVRKDTICFETPSLALQDDDPMLASQDGPISEGGAGDDSGHRSLMCRGPEVSLDPDPREPNMGSPSDERPPAPDAAVEIESEPEAQEEPSGSDGLHGPYPVPPHHSSQDTCGFKWPTRDPRGGRINQGCGRPPYLSAREWCYGLSSRKARKAETHRYIVAERA